MDVFYKILHWILYPFELFLRFWFPYKFKDDPYNPEPQSKQERKKQRFERKKNKHQSDDDEQSESVDVEDNETPDITEKTEEEKALEHLDNLAKPKQARPKLGLEMIDVYKPLTKASSFDMIKNSNPRITYYFHDIDYHQIAVKFEPRSIKPEYKVRDDAERKKLKPLLFPIQDVWFDRTHVIPIGYHGSESDKRLLVGFNSELNQNELKHFEEKVANINRTKTILWFVSIERQLDKSARWNTTVWDEKGKVLMEDSFHDPKEFVWLKKRW